MSFRAWLGALISGTPANSQSAGRPETASYVVKDRNASGVLDLRDTPEMTFRLLDDTGAWRERAVHVLRLSDVDHVNASTAYQVRIPTEIVRSLGFEAVPGQLVRLLLPLTVRRKELLLGLDFVGAGQEPCALLLREDVAALQANYVERELASGSGAGPELSDLWYGISAYTPDHWRHHLDLQRRWRRKKGRAKRALVQYLNSDLNLGVSRADVERWTSELAPVRLALITALDEGPDFESPAELPLLGIPFMQYRPQDIGAIDRLIAAYAAAVDRMTVEERALVTEYGRRWEMVVDTVVPLDQPVSVKVTDQRPWTGSPSAVLEQAIPFRDARTVHVEIRASDRSVRLCAPKILDLHGTRVDLSAESIRTTEDFVSVYAAAPDRPYFIRVRIKAAARRSQKLLVGFLLVLILMAAGVAVSLPDGNNLVDALAVLSFPLTLAGAVVLSRETSGLAERLMSRWRTALAAAILVLWVITLGKMVLNTDEDWAEDGWTSMKERVDDAWDECWDALPGGA